MSKSPTDHPVYLENIDCFVMGAMKPLYKQDVHHFDDLYPTLKAHKSQVIRTVHSGMKSQVLFKKYKILILETMLDTM